MDRPRPHTVARRTIARGSMALAWALAAQLALPFAVSPAHAEDYPAKPVRIIVGFIPGSAAVAQAAGLKQ